MIGQELLRNQDVAEDELVILRRSIGIDILVARLFLLQAEEE
jgi:hypothetical protein